MNLKDIDVLVQERQKYQARKAELDAARSGIVNIACEGRTLSNAHEVHGIVLRQMQPLLVEKLQKLFDEQVARLTMLGITEFD